MSDCSKLDYTENAALLLSKVVLDLWPNAELVSHNQTSQFFSCQFYHTSELKEEVMCGLEESFYLAQGNHPNIELCEMLSSNALTLLSHLGHRRLIDQLPHPKVLVYLARIGQHYDFASGDLLEGYEGKAQILDLQTKNTGKEGCQITLIGSWANDNKTLKAQKKAYREIKKIGVLNAGKDLNLWQELGNHCLLENKGHQLFKKVKNKIENLCVKAQFQETFSNKNSNDFQKNINRACEKTNFTSRYFAWSQAEESSKNFFYCGELKSPYNLYLKLGTGFLKEKRQQECNYCLKFILEIFKILGFSYEVVCCQTSSEENLKNACDSLDLKYELLENQAEDKVVVKAIDRWKRSLASFKVHLTKFEGKTQLLAELNVTLDQLIIWMLEAKLLEQELSDALFEVRLLVLSQAQNYGLEVYSLLEEDIFPLTMDLSKDPLKTKLHRAYKEKVPYILIVGEEEKDKEILTLKEKGSLKDKLISPKEFINYLKGREQD